jgi:HlyD family secretion protein
MAAVNNTGLYARHRLLIWAVGIIVAVIVLAAFMSMRQDTVPVRAATANRDTIRSEISTNGKVEPLQNFEAHAPISTTVRRVLVKEGEHVRKGQLMVQLNDFSARDQAARAMSQVEASAADLSAIHSGGTQEEVLTTQAQLAKAKTDRDAAERNLEAVKRLQQKGAASAGEVKNAQDQLQRAEADLKFLQQKRSDRYSQPEVARVEAQKTYAQTAYSAAEDVLSQLDIRAPFDGTVYSLPVKQGGFVAAGDLVLQEADLSKVLVRAFVDEPDIGRLSPGEKIEVTWDAIPQRIWEGSVNSVPSVVKLRGTRNIGETTCIVSNTDGKLLPNVNVGVIIITSQHGNTLTVPREALRLDGDQHYVYQITSDQLQRRDVQTGISNLTEVEITSGLPDNALVALGSTNAKPLRNGLQVKVVR